MNWRRLVREIAREYQSVRPLRYHQGYPDESGGTVPGDIPITVAPQSYHGWELLALAWQVNAVAGDVVPIISIQDREGNEILPIYLPPVVMGDSLFLYMMQGGAFGVQTVATFTGQLYPLPLDGELKDEQLVFGLFGGAAADNHRVTVYYEEFDWPPGRNE